MTFHTGYPWSTVTNSFPINFTQLGPAVLIGPKSAVKQHIHKVIDPNSGAPGLQLFADPNAAVGAFAYPFGVETGERNTLRGPRYFNIDMALLKTFKMPWEGHTLQFRAEAFNAFNHPSFNPPSLNAVTNNSNINNSSQYGFLSSTANLPRELSLGLRYRF